jgi:urease accessory protein
MKKIILVAVLIAISDAASAHTGLLPTDGFSHGFQHPFLGLDHFLVMLGLGLWASSQSRKLADQAIGVFLLFMAAGTLLGLAGIGFAYVETAILVSLLFVGMALSFGTTSIVPTLRRGNSVCNAPALRDAGASTSAFPRRSVGTIRR